jgi:hypothetical protein
LSLIHLEFGAEHRPAADRILNSLGDSYDIPLPTDILPWVRFTWFVPQPLREIENMESVWDSRLDEAPSVKEVASTTIEDVDEFYGHRTPFVVHKSAPLPTPGVMRHPKQDTQRRPTVSFARRSVRGSGILFS